jgi:RNA polymerase sigma factor (sigma-70 family)
MDLSDGVLVRKTLEGDDFAFGTLVNRHSGVVHGLCYHLVRNFTDAADLTQESFIKAYFRLSSLSDPSKFLSWLRQITINVCHDWLRRQQNDTVPLEAISGRPAISPSPAEICEAEELQEKVAEAIASLSEKNRQAVTLYYLDGCSCNEVADFLDVSVSVVQSRLYEARKLLKKELIAMVKENLVSHRLSENFEEMVLKAIEQARKSRSQHVYREVITYCDEALDALVKLPDSVEHKKMRKEALWLKGDAFNQHADRERAIKYHEEALELEKEIGDRSSQARLMGEIARHYSNAGNKEKAVEYEKRALDIYTELGDKAGQARILQSLGGGSLSSRSVEEAIPYYQRALDLFVEVGDKEGEASSHAGVNLLEQFGGQIAAATSQEGQSRTVFYGAVRETFSKSSDALVYIGLAGSLGAYVWIDVQIEGDKDKLKCTPSPFRFCFLPYMANAIKLLDFSLSVGDSWSMDIPSGGLDPMKLTVTIQSDSEIVSVPAGKFPDCLKTKMVTTEEPEDRDENRCGEREFIYAPGVGLIKSTFVRRDGTMDIVQLAECTVSGSSEDYFPLEVGNKWFYEWADEEGGFPSTDVYEVIGIDNNGRHQVSHYHYALKQTQARR